MACPHFSKEALQLAKKGQRLIGQYRQNTMSIGTKILVDRQTGANCPFRYAGGLTPLLGRDGKPVVTTILNED